MPQAVSESHRMEYQSTSALIRDFIIKWRLPCWILVTPAQRSMATAAAGIASNHSLDSSHIAVGNPLYAVYVSVAYHRDSYRRNCRLPVVVVVGNNSSLLWRTIDVKDDWEPIFVIPGVCCC